MVSSWCAGILLFVASCSLKVCPFFYKTSRGILCLHWTLINFLISTSGSHPIDSSCLLISLATLLCLVEHITTMHKPEVELTLGEQMSLSCFLLCFDAVCSIFSKIAQTEVSLLLLLSHISILFFIWVTDRKADRKLTTERVRLGSVDLFTDALKPFAFLGLGGLHYVSIVLAIVAQIPTLNSSRLIQDMIYLIRSLGTLTMFLTPAYLGGFIHFLKSSGTAPNKTITQAKSEVFNA